MLVAVARDVSVVVVRIVILVHIVIEEVGAVLVTVTVAGGRIRQVQALETLEIE